MGSHFSCFTVSCDVFLISYAYFCAHSYLYLISSRLFIPVGPHKAVVEVSNIGHYSNYSRGELL